VGTLMRRMGIQALYRKPNTSKKHPTHKVYPYLLRGMKIDRANQVWATEWWPDDLGAALATPASRFERLTELAPENWTGR